MRSLEFFVASLSARGDTAIAELFFVAGVGQASQIVEVAIDPMLQGVVPWSGSLTVTLFDLDDDGLANVSSAFYPGIVNFFVNQALFQHEFNGAPGVSGIGTTVFNFGGYYDCGQGCINFGVSVAGISEDVFTLIGRFDFPGTAPVSIPGTLALLGAGLLGAGAVRRRRN